MAQSQSFWAPQPFNTAAMVAGTSQRSALRDQMGDPMAFAGQLLDARTELYQQSLAGNAAIRSAGIEGASKIRAVKEAMAEEEGTNWGGVLGGLASAGLQLMTPTPKIPFPAMGGGGISGAFGGASRAFSGR